MVRPVTITDVVVDVPSANTAQVFPKSDEYSMMKSVTGSSGAGVPACHVRVIRPAPAVGFSIPGGRGTVRGMVVVVVVGSVVVAGGNAHTPALETDHGDVP